MPRVNPVKFGKVERLDLHHKAILRFIKNSPNCTENQVVKAMDAEPKGCSKMTTLRKLDELIEKQEISDLLNKGERGFHRFIINEHNIFNKIYATLSEIESLINKMDDNTENMKNHDEFFKEYADIYMNDPHQFLYEIGLYHEFEKLKSNFTEAYHEAVNAILHKLLSIVNEEILIEKDSQILYMKILDLLNKLSAQFSNIDLNDKLESMNNELKNVKSSEKSERLNLDVKLADEVIVTLENFKTQFLVDAKQEARRTT